MIRGNLNIKNLTNQKVQLLSNQVKLSSKILWYVPGNCLLAKKIKEPIKIHCKKTLVLIYIRTYEFGIFSMKKTLIGGAHRFFETNCMTSVNKVIRMQGKKEHIQWFGANKPFHVPICCCKPWKYVNFVRNHNKTLSPRQRSLTNS